MDRMNDRRADALKRLADPGVQVRLERLGLDWSPLDTNVCGAAWFKRGHPEAPPVVGLIGGASSGKSTLFNTLCDFEASRISAHAHETVGPLAAPAAEGLDDLRVWIDEQRMFGGLGVAADPTNGASPGSVSGVTLVARPGGALGEAVVVDTPDVTSQMSAEEGSLTAQLLPWFDAVIIVVDEERWFDAAVFEEHAGLAEAFGQSCFVMFNRTGEGPALATAERSQLADHAAARRAAGHCVSPYRPGSGYRPLAPETRAVVLEWIGRLPAGGRSAALERRVRRRCAELLQCNVERVEQFEALCHDVDQELIRQAGDAHLTTDLLTPDERRLLGLGHRFLPLYDLLQNISRRWSRWVRPAAASEAIDFNKSPGRLAEVLSRNLDHRFRHVADRVDHLIGSSDYYGAAPTAWQTHWQPPAFDAAGWARKIQAHIETWKAESQAQSRRADLAAMAVGVPLLLADLLLLGGAGMTLAWTTTSVAGWFGAKTAVRLLQGSAAFKEYQTTVRAYQALVREALVRQWEQNLNQLPRRHLAMSDPVLEAVIEWSTPTAT